MVVPQSRMTCQVRSMASNKNILDDTKKLMSALVRMKPKPHEEMKVGKKASKKAKAPEKKKPGR
jgi:hypothetical protein